MEIKLDGLVFEGNSQELSKYLLHHILYRIENQVSPQEMAEIMYFLSIVITGTFLSGYSPEVLNPQSHNHFNEIMSYVNQVNQEIDQAKPKKS